MLGLELVREPNFVSVQLQTQSRTNILHKKMGIFREDPRLVKKYVLTLYEEEDNGKRQTVQIKLEWRYAYNSIVTTLLPSTDLPQTRQLLYLI